ncbi:MAG: ArsC/Spx/MgsR family protein [Candidatus Dormibacteria bacterium]
MSAATAPRPYQASVTTTAPPHDVLDQLARSSVAGTAVTERGDSYVVFQPPGRSFRPELAAAVTAAVVILVLALAAVSVLFIVLLPLAALPFAPLLLHHRPACAVSALDDGGGRTQVVAHGEAAPELAEALDDFLQRLPTFGSVPPSPGGPVDQPAATESPAGVAGFRPAAAGTLPVGAVRLPGIAGADTVPGSPAAGTAVVLFDPASPTCREVCRLLDSRGVSVTTVRFLEHTPTRADLERVARLLELGDVRRMVRTDHPLYADLQLDEATQDQVMSALTLNPDLLQRPIVLRDHRAVIARPAERVLLLLDGFLGAPAPVA